MSSEALIGGKVYCVKYFNSPEFHQKYKNVPCISRNYTDMSFVSYMVYTSILYINNMNTNY